MKKEYIPIYKIAGKIQYLTEVLPQIETNTILCKTLTGLGATYSEIKSKRHSIISVPNVPPIIGKCKDPKHKNDNLFGVKQGVTTEEIIDYIEKTLAAGKFIKLISTPEGFTKIKRAFEELELDIYNMCFFLSDECDKLIKDVDYRADIILPMDDFFKFREKAFVSATPILPSDPRFESQGFKIVEIQPTFDYKRPISIVQTNNVLEALKEILPQIKAQQEQPRSICFFANSVDMIHQLMSKLGIENESAVFCAEKSVEKLKKKGFKQAYEHWNSKHKMPYMWFTCRFYTAVDIELEEQPDIVFVTEPYFAEYTIIDPCTDAVQAVGRFRNGTSFIVHIVNANENYPIRTQAGIKEYLKGCRDAYKTIKNLYECATSSESRNAYKAALDILPYNRMLKDGKTNYFAIDNFVDEALVKSAYNNIDSVVNRYKESSLFLPKLTQPLFYKLGDKERLSLMDKSSSIKESRKRIVELLESLKDDRDSPLAQSFISDIRQVDAFIIDAYKYKVHTSLSEYYIDRIITGLPATINYQGRKYPLRITKVVPEVKDRTFDVDLVFTGDMPDNVRVGKSFRVQIELGQPEEALVIPRGNFYQSTGGQWIYKLNAAKTKAVRVPLGIGRQNPQQYEITEGLQPGDWVITTGYDTFGEAEELIMK